MPAPRKVFRIEESGHVVQRGKALPHDSEDLATLRHHEIINALAALRAALDHGSGVTPRQILPHSREQIAQAHEFKRELDLIHEAIRRTKQDIGGFDGSTFIGPQMARVGRELDAVIAGTEQATQSILKSAEDIDQIANTLTSMIKGSYELGLVQDLRDHVVRIFEASNFQDLTGQRIGKVIATLKFIEDHINRMQEIWASIEGAASPAPAGSAELAAKKARPAVPDAALLNGPKLAGDSGHASQADIDILFSD